MPSMGLPLSVACRYSGAGGLEGDEEIDGCDVVCGRALLVDGVVDGHFW